jgi:hypothetical protein
VQTRASETRRWDDGTIAESDQTHSAVIHLCPVYPVSRGVVQVQVHDVNTAYECRHARGVHLHLHYARHRKSPGMRVA